MFVLVTTMVYTTPMKSNYKAVRIKNDTYKKIKQLALDVDMPITKVIDRLYHERKLGKFKSVD